MRSAKVHLVRKGDKTYACGRPLDAGHATTDDPEKVTCGSCRTPNEPIFYNSPRGKEDI